MRGFSLPMCFSLVLVLCSTAGHAIDPAGYGQPAGEFDIRTSRVPAAELAVAKMQAPPFAATAEVLAEGKAIFLGRGTCFQCHGLEGKVMAARRRFSRSNPATSRIPCSKSCGLPEK